MDVAFPSRRSSPRPPVPPAAPPPCRSQRVRLPHQDRRCQQPARTPRQAFTAAHRHALGNIPPPPHWSKSVDTGEHEPHPAQLRPVACLAESGQSDFPTLRRCAGVPAAVDVPPTLIPSEFRGWLDGARVYLFLSCRWLKAGDPAHCGRAPDLWRVEISLDGWQAGSGVSRSSISLQRAWAIPEHHGNFGFLSRSFLTG